MRDIKFRGKRIGSGEWVCGNLVFVNDGDTGNRHPNIVISYHHDTFDWVEVIPETIGQYNGLEDKNGKEIYEGDILNEDGQLFEVKYSSKWAKFHLNSINHIQYPEWNRGVEMIIVGNIHDNPELIK